MLQTPAGPGVRDDGGVYEGWTVPIDYDPLISKLAVWGSARGEAIARMHRALREYRIEGIKTNISFFLEILNHPDFLTADFDTGFIDLWRKNRNGDATLSAADRDLAAIAAAAFHSQRSIAPPQTAKHTENLWKLDGRRRGLRGS